MLRSPLQGVSLLFFLHFHPSWTSELIDFSRSFTFLTTTLAPNHLDDSEITCLVFNCGAEEKEMGNNISD